jgi:hypothetical protein
MNRIGKILRTNKKLQRKIKKELTILRIKIVMIRNLLNLRNRRMNFKVNNRKTQLTKKKRKNSCTNNLQSKHKQSQTLR